MSRMSLRRAAAILRKRSIRLMRRYGGWPESADDRRRRVIEAGWRAPKSVIARVVELPTQSSGLDAAFVNPSILILQLAHIGDFVLSLRAARKIRAAFPEAEITLVCASWNVEWAKSIGLFNRVAAFDFFSALNKDWKGSTPELFARFEALDLGSFDIAVDLRHDADTRPCLYRVKAKAQVGYAAPQERGLPALDLWLPAVENLALPNGREYSLHAELRLELLADALIDAFAASAQAHPATMLAAAYAQRSAPPYVVLAVGAGDSIRRWPEADFVAIGSRLAAEFKIVVVGGTAELDIVGEIVAALPQGGAEACVNLPLTEVAARVAGAALVIGLGSGVTHLAATLGVPTIALLSGVSPLAVWRPVGRQVVSLTGETPCSPCGLKDEKDCPFGVVCLRSITPDRVWAAKQRLIAREGRGIGVPGAERGAALAGSNGQTEGQLGST